jgi:hypothetical protein
MMPSLTETLGAFVADTGFDAIPAGVIESDAMT